MDHLVDLTHVAADAIFNDDEPAQFGMRVAVTYRNRRSSKEHVMMFDRGTLVELLTELACRGAAADREFPSELVGAIEAGLERHRKESMKS